MSQLHRFEYKRISANRGLTLTTHSNLFANLFLVCRGYKKEWSLRKRRHLSVIFTLGVIRIQERFSIKRATEKQNNYGQFESKGEFFSPTHTLNINLEK